MKRIMIVIWSLLLAFSLTACGMNGDTPQSAASFSPSIPVETESSRPADSSGTAALFDTERSEQPNADNRIRIMTAESNEIVFQLNDSPAASDFYRQLPLLISVEDYAGSEKIFYPPEKLDTGSTPTAQGPAGTLAYYAPWGNVAIFYDECKGASGLYELGQAVSGTEFISEMTGDIQIEAFRTSPAPSNPTEPESASTQQTQPPAPSAGERSGLQESESETMKMNVQVGNETFSATLEDNAASKAFVELMKNAPVVIRMSDYSGFEKVGPLGTGLPASNSQITAQSGDIVLYNGNQIVIFYGSNSWSYTRLGRIDDLTGWAEALGIGDVTVAFRLDEGGSWIG